MNHSHPDHTQRPAMAVIGAGFAALSAVRRLRKLDRSVEITVIAPSAELHFLPGIIWIPSGLRKREDLIIPLDDFFRRMNVSFMKANVTGLRDGGRVVETDAGDVSNDGLIIATGGRFIKSLPGIEHSITPCEGIAAAEQIRDRLAAMKGGTIAIGFAGNPKEPSAMRGGPMFGSCSASTGSSAARSAATASSSSSSAPRRSPARASARRLWRVSRGRWKSAGLNAASGEAYSLRAG